MGIWSCKMTERRGADRLGLRVAAINLSCRVFPFTGQTNHPASAPLQTSTGGGPEARPTGDPSHCRPYLISGAAVQISIEICRRRRPDDSRAPSPRPRYGTWSISCPPRTPSRSPPSRNQPPPHSRTLASAVSTCCRHNPCGLICYGAGVAAATRRIRASAVSAYRSNDLLLCP